jgi:hypothetical protein
VPAYTLARVLARSSNTLRLKFPRHGDSGVARGHDAARLAVGVAVQACAVLMLQLHVCSAPVHLIAAITSSIHFYLTSRK